MLSLGRTRILIWIAVTLAWIIPAAAQPPSRSVLVLDQSAMGLPFNAQLANDIRLTLNAESGAPVSLYIEHLDLNRFRGPSYEASFILFLNDKYHGKIFDVIITIGPAALDFVLRHHGDVWPDVPVVFTLVGEATATHLLLPQNVTGVAMQLTLQDMVAVARMVVPNLRRIAIVGDPLERQTIFRPFIDELPIVAAQFQIIDLTGLPFAELRRRLGTLPEDTAVIYTGLYYDGEGVSHIPSELVGPVAEWANRPLVISVEALLGKGAVGGYIVSAKPMAQSAARLALRIFKGEVPSNISVTKVGSPLIFEWPALQRWGISAADLPEGSEVRFRPPTMWDQYRWQVIAGLSVILLQAAMITWLIIEHRRRRIAEVESRHRLSELTQMNRRASAGELSASISHEVNQPLAAIVANANAGLRWLAKDTPDLGEAQAALKSIARDGNRAAEVIGTLRAMFKKDSEERALLDVNPLIQNVIALIHGELDQQKILVESELADNLPKISANRVQFQQVILNLAVNAKDAMGSVTDRPRVLRLRSEAHNPNGVVISVKDSGTGIDADKIEHIFEPLFTTKTDGMGMGLAICRSIIEAHGGQLSALPAHPYGTVFRIVLPTVK